MIIFIEGLLCHNTFQEIINWLLNFLQNIKSKRKKMLNIKSEGIILEKTILPFENKAVLNAGRIKK